MYTPQMYGNGMMQNPYQGIAQNPYQTAFGMQQKTEVVRVNGENGAKAYQLPPNSSILLLDESAPVVWLKQTDGAGYPTITPYQISPVQTQSETAAAQVAVLEERVKRLEEVINAKSNNRGTRSRTAANDGESGTD